MKSILSSLIFAFVLTLHSFPVQAAEGSAKDAVKKAATALNDQSNYSWTSTPKNLGASTWRQGPTDGKANKEGVAHMKFEINDNQIEIAFNGDHRAIYLEGGWESSEDLDGDRSWIRDSLKAMKTPAGEAADLLSYSGDLKASGDGTYSGDFTQEGVKQAIARLSRRGNSSAPKDAKGSVKFWLKEGALTKYEYTVQAKIRRGDNDEEVELNRTTTVEIKNVGSTKVELPADARKKVKL